MGIEELSTAEAKRQFEKAERTRRQAIEDDLVIAGDSLNRWAVVSLGGLFRWNQPGTSYGEQDPAPVVIYHGLTTREAAECARWEAIEDLAGDGKPYQDCQVTITYLNAVGRIMKVLREAGLKHSDMKWLTHHLFFAAQLRNEPCNYPGAPDDDGIPF